jgi:Ca-activated chloride channel homolog
MLVALTAGCLNASGSTATESEPPMAARSAGVPGLSVGAGGTANAGYGGSTGAAGATGYGGSGWATASDAGVAPWAGAGGSSGTGGSTSHAGTGGAGTEASADGGPEAGVDAEADAGYCAALDHQKPLVLYQSADDSNSMASPAIARRLIELGQMVPAQVLRPYEFLNYYRIAYEPAPASRVRVVPQLQKDPAGGYTLQIGIQSERAPSPRRPMNITFVLDNSGSMGGDPIAIERAAVRAIAAAMRAGDRVSMVTWNTANRTLLDGYVVSGPDDPTLLAAADLLDANGATDLSGGLQAGYQLAQKYYAMERMNRVVLISDGQANTGLTDEQLIGNASHMQDQEGIYLVGVSVGDGINDTLMNVVTDKGRGASIYLDGTDEADKMLRLRFDEAMEIAARSVRLELTLPWYFGLAAFSGEQSSTVAAAVEPQHLAPDDAMVFNETLVPCGPDIVSAADVISAKATYETPITHLAQEDSATATVGELLDGAHAELVKGSAIFAYADALRFAAMYPATGGARLDAALAKVEAANPGGVDPELTEIAGLIRRYRPKFP